MGVRIGAGISTHPDARVGADEASEAAARQLAGAPACLALVFASGNHLAAPEATLEGVHDVLAPAHVVGCGAGGVLGAGREVEAGTAVAVWALAGERARARPFVVEAEPGPDGVVLGPLPDLDGAAAAVLLADPLSFPTERALATLERESPGVPVLGGVASARTAEGTSALFVGDRVVDAGAVGVALSGVEVLPAVSQGAAPVGPELTVTAAEGNIVHELAGRPALECIRELLEELDARERLMLSSGLLLGISVEHGTRVEGGEDFLVRGIIGVDADAGTVAVGAVVHPGQVVQLHARDAGSADRDLRDTIGLRMRALGGVAPAGALAFTCNGRGRAMFGESDHDARALAGLLADAPVAGFFAAGEIGPLAGRSFLHGFSATVAVFPA